MHALVLALAIASSPAPSTLASRLAWHIMTTSPSAAPYAAELARRIIWEAEHHGLDPALFAAICYLESRYRLYPHGGSPTTHLTALWQVYPSDVWLLQSRAVRLRLSRSVVVSTWRAAMILLGHVRRCGDGPACYCRYNRTPCRRGYIVSLYRQARAIREVLMHHGRPR